MEQAQEQSISPQTRGPSVIPLATVFVFILVLLLTFVAYLYAQNQSLRDELMKKEATLNLKSQFQDPRVETDTQETPEDILDWQTYTDKKNGFSISYPVGYESQLIGDELLISPKRSPGTENVIQPRLAVSVREITFETEDAYIDNIIEKCEEGMGCRKIGTEDLGNRLYYTYVGESYTVESKCSVSFERILNKMIIACDTAFNDDLLRKQILQTLHF